MGCNMRYYNLTHPQKRIWNIEKVNSGSPLHNLGGCLKINGCIDVDILKESINSVISRNEGLRIRVTEKDGQPVQYVHKFESEDIDYLDFANCETPIAKHKEWSENLFENNFEFEGSQLYYFAVYKISEKEYGILLKIHHIISDGWSISLIEKQICETYVRLSKGEDAFNGEYYSYIDFIEEENDYLNSERLVKNREFWKEKFYNTPGEFLYRISDSLKGARLSFDIESSLSAKIMKYIDDEKCSLNTLFITILLIYMNKTIGAKDLVIGTPTFNRSGMKQKNMVGMFTSTVPFRFAMYPDSSIESLIKSINRELKACFFNQKYPYDLLIKDLELNKEGYNSLFKMCVNYYNSKYVSDINDIGLEVQEYYSGSQSYSMQLTVKEMGKDNITLNFDYKVDEYPEQEIQAMYQCMLNIIKQILANKNVVVSDIKLLDEEEVRYKIYELNSTSSTYPDKTVYELFEIQALKTPYTIAAEFLGEVLTYKELDEKSNQLANYLRKNGISKDTIVAIMETHSMELLISILGVLKAGGAYLPIDPGYPSERVNYMLKDSESSILLVNSDINDAFEFTGIITNINDSDFCSYSKEKLVSISGPDDLAYVIYTSGSTGKPKGVMIEHRSLTNYIYWANKMYLQDRPEVVAFYSSTSFDLTVTSIFTPLISGNKVLIYDNNEVDHVLYRILKEGKTTVMKLTPSHLALLKDMDNINSSIKKLIVGGEDLKVNLAKDVYNSFGKKIEIFNEYGPTETTVGCMIYKYDEEKDKGVSVPIGYPADNVQIYILDSSYNVVPTGIVGELYVSGDGVARGYFNKKDLTCERFIENPFASGSRMYRTGDTARYLSNGAIEYTGRIDNQVKIRGHRIELGEIEKYLLEHEAVNAAVVAIKDDTLGNKSIRAYLVCRKNVTDTELKNYLSKFLPQYMIPNCYIFMDNLPLTGNGKVNYSLLPNPKLDEKEFVNYKTYAEQEVAKVMEEVLGIKDVSMNDNFYQLGGDSIKAIQISSKLKDRGMSLRVKDILACDSIEKIAASVEASGLNSVIGQEQCQGYIDNTPITKWFFINKFYNVNCYNQYVLLEFNGDLDANKVAIAEDMLVKHHDALRINYDAKLNKLYYNEKHLKEQCSIKYLDLSKNFYYGEEQKLKCIINEAKVMFDIEDSLLFNITMLNLKDEAQALLFTAHHLIVDGISWRIILDDFITILKQLDNNEEIKLPLKTHSYKKWSELLQDYGKKDFEEEKKYWNSILEKTFIYPLDFDKEEDFVNTASTISYELDENITSGLIKRANDIYGIDLNEVLIIALAFTINKITRDDDVVIEVERHGRDPINQYVDVSRTVGWFTSIYPVYLKVENKGIDYSIKAAKEQLRAIPNKGFNYSILKFLNCELLNANYSNIRFNYLGDFDNIMEEKWINVHNIEFGLQNDEENSLTALIDIAAMILNKKLKINITYSTNRFRHETAREFAGLYIGILEMILEHCTNRDSREFTPSDFDAVEISQDDLNTLLD